MSEVDLDKADGVGVITLMAAERRNALNPAMAAELEAVCDEIDGDSGIGAAVIRGDGGHFCAGAVR